MKNNTAKKWCKNRFLSSTWRWPPRVETCCSNFNLHKYSCVDRNFYVIYNKLNASKAIGLHVKVKVKFSCYRLGVAQRVGRNIALLFHDHGTRVVSSKPRPHFTPVKDPVPILQEAGWAQGQSGWAENLVPTGIRSRTVQPVVSRYTDWATQPTVYM